MAIADGASTPIVSTTLIVFGVALDEPRNTRPEYVPTAMPLVAAESASVSPPAPVTITAANQPVAPTP